MNIFQKKGFLKTLDNRFILPFNKRWKWEIFIKITDSILPLPKYQIRYPKNKCAVIVELRRHPHLSYILRNVMYFLDKSWGLHIFHGTENEEYIKKIVDEWGTVILTNLEKSNLSPIEFNGLLTSIDFWNELKSEHILIFQTDSILRKKGIDEFLQYDYVGAPWKLYGAPEFGGNGGLSLRRRSVMLEILEKNYIMDAKYQEDLFFCEKLVDGRYNIAPRDVAMRFSVEELFYHDPIGVHALWKLHKSKQIDTILRGVQYNIPDSNKLHVLE